MELLAGLTVLEQHGSSEVTTGFCLLRKVENITISTVSFRGLKATYHFTSLSVLW